MIHGTIYRIFKKLDLNGKTVFFNHKPRLFYKYNKITFIFGNIF